MTVQATEEMTIRLPRSLVSRVKETAEAMKQPVDQVVADALLCGLPETCEMVAATARNLEHDLRDQAVDALREAADLWFPEDQQVRLSALLRFQRSRPLRPEEAVELDALIAAVEDHAAKRAAARLLLGRTQTHMR